MVMVMVCLEEEIGCQTLFLYQSIYMYVSMLCYDMLCVYLSNNLYSSIRIEVIEEGRAVKK